MIRFLSGKLKKHMKLAKIVKISIFVNRLVFPMNFNRFSHPMTLSSSETFTFFACELLVTSKNGGKFFKYHEYGSWNANRYR